MNTIFEEIENSICHINFNAAYINMGINLDEVRDRKTGKINVSEDIQAVIIAKHIIVNIEKCGYFVAKQNDMLLIYAGKCWSNINESDWSRFIRDAPLRVSYDKSIYSTVKFNKLLNQTLLMYLPNFKYESSLSITNIVQINCQNGTLRISKDGATELFAHDKNNLFRYCLGYDYMGDAVAPLFMEYLNKILPDEESRQLLQEIFGAVLAKDLKLEFIGIFLGDGGNGKSVLHSIMLALFGTYNVSTLSWSQLLHETSRVDLEGKLLNYSSEINSGVLSGRADIIKILASKEPIYVRRYYNQSYQMIDYGRILLNANRMPPLIEFSHAYLRRLKLVTFDQRIADGDIDINLSNNIIKDELSGILNWVIVGCRRIMHNNRFTDSSKSQLRLKQYVREQNPVSAFIEEFGYEPSMDGQKIKFKTLYNEFIIFCTSNKLKFVNSHEFGRDLRQLHFEVKKGAQNKSFIFATKIFCDEDG